MPTVAVGLLGAAARASVACEMTSGWEPKRLDRWMRARLPPTEACTTLRIETSGSPCRVRGSAAAGAADQLPTQLPEEAGAVCPSERGPGALNAFRWPPMPTKMAVETRTTTAASPASRA